MFSGIIERGQCHKFLFSDMQITIRSAIDHSKSEKLCSSPLFVTGERIGILMKLSTKCWLFQSEVFSQILENIC